MFTEVLAVYSTVLKTRLAAFTLAVFRFSTRTVKSSISSDQPGPSDLDGLRKRCARRNVFPPSS
jgi:hypothetical protein